MRRWMIVAVAGVSAAFAGASAFAFVGTSDATTAAKTRTLYVSAVEWKGSASVANEAYPGPVPAGGRLRVLCSR